MGWKCFKFVLTVTLPVPVVCPGLNRFQMTHHYLVTLWSRVCDFCATTGMSREEIQRLFSVTSDEKLVEESTCLSCVESHLLTSCIVISICQIYSLSPQNLLYKWEAINFNSSATHSEISPFSMDSVAALKALLRRELAKDSGRRASRAIPPGNMAVVNRSRIPANIARVMNTGAKNRRYTDQRGTEWSNSQQGRVQRAQGGCTDSEGPRL